MRIGPTDKGTIRISGDTTFAKIDLEIQDEKTVIIHQFVKKELSDALIQQISEKSRQTLFEKLVSLSTTLLVGDEMTRERIHKKLETCLADFSIDLIETPIP